MTNILAFTTHSKTSNDLKAASSQFDIHPAAFFLI